MGVRREGNWPAARPAEGEVVRKGTVNTKRYFLMALELRQDCDIALGNATFATRLDSLSGTFTDSDPLTELLQQEICQGRDQRRLGVEPPTCQ